MHYLAMIIWTINFGFADDRFHHLREDVNVPPQCQQMNIDNFSISGIERFYFGRAYGLQMGYTFEYPVKRNNARKLWWYFKDHIDGKPSMDLLREIKNNPELNRDYEIILANYQDMGVDFGNEGDVLEVLATVELRERFPAPLYFITGGIEYRLGHGHRTIGEIDLYVGHSSDCAAHIVGEVKLGSGRALGKAKKQLSRFSNFLVEQGMPSLASEYEPTFADENVLMVGAANH